MPLSSLSPQILAFKSRLLKAGVQNPEKDIETLSKHAETESELIAHLERRENREPIERITGTCHFLGNDFELTKNVFKPGFETETITDHALLYAQQLNKPVNILDLGTGTGCILISLLKQLPDATGTGIDITEESIACATRNAERHGVMDRIKFYKSDWTKNIAKDKFDIIISNPPRTPQKLIPALVKEVSLYDPEDSLDGGEDGLHYYREIARDLRKLGQKDAHAFIQIGELTLKSAIRIFEEQGFENIQILGDYKYVPNCIMVRNNEQPQTLLSRIKSKFGLY